MPKEYFTEKGHKFAIGADPELFVVDGNGKPVSAHGMIPGTKRNPFVLSNGAVQVDGMALEFNVTPSGTPSEFSKNILYNLKALKKMLPKGYSFSPDVSVDFDEDYLKSLPKEATELGCDPDFNAYTGRQNPTPDANVNFRTASGHIHVGWTNNEDPFDPGHFEACRELASVLDLQYFNSLAGIDRDKRRVSLYGKAGAFRPKHYGMEYRVPSNRWIWCDETRKDMYNIIRQSIVFCFNNYNTGGLLKNSHNNSYIKNYNEGRLNLGYHPWCVFKDQNVLDYLQVGELPPDVMENI